VWSTPRPRRTTSPLTKSAFTKTGSSPPARKDAESLRIKADAESAAELRRLAAENERVKLSAEAEAEKLRLAFEAHVEEAKALAAHPEFVRMK